MRQRTLDKLLVTMLAAGVGLSAVGCLSTDTTSALAELAASTTGSAAEILVTGFLDARLSTAAEPDLSAPIAEQMQ